MVWWNLRQAHLQELGLMHIPSYHGSYLDEGHEPRQLHGHDPWLMFEVTLDMSITNFHIFEIGLVPMERALWVVFEVN